MPEQDVYLLKYALVDYRGIFKQDCETGKRLDKIIRILDLATDRAFLNPKEKPMSFEEMLNEKEKEEQ